MEIRYAAGDSVLVGAGEHWVLVTDPGDDDVLEALWAVMVAGRAAACVTEQLLAIVEQAFAGVPPDLVIVDATGGSSTSVSRGRGHVRSSGPDQILSLDGGDERAAMAHSRRLTGGIVAASGATLRPLASSGAPAASVSTAAQQPAASPVLIDGIPESILSAKGPEGAPPSPRRRLDREPDSDTGGLSDTVEPDPDFMERISQGTHTTIRPPELAPVDEVSSAVAEAGDHDGSTLHRPEPVSHLRTGPTTSLLAVSCGAGHLSSPDASTCRVCRKPIAPQQPRQVTRPVLGGLRLPTGEVVPLDRGVVLGRKPAPLADSIDWPHLVHLPSDHTFVSRMHLHIELDGWSVLARDLDSRGGTMLTMPGRAPERMRAGEAYSLEPGARLDLAEVYEVRFEVTPVVPR